MAAPAFERVPEIAPASGGLAERLHKIWETEPGFVGWLSSVDHKEIGRRYIVTAFLFLLLGGIEAGLMRIQLARPDATFLSPEQYNEVFSTHAVTMMFWYGLPILSGFSNFLWPLIFGARDMAYPRLNALSYWIYLASGILLYIGVFSGQAPNAGWFNYVPLTERTFDPGRNIDFYALAVVFLGVSTTIGSANFVVTFLRTRAPGMAVNRVPMMTWGTLTASVANLLTVPAVSLAFFLLWMDRQIGTHFFDAALGSQALLWQHLFWIFGHPWVYVLVLPAQAMVSEGLPTFCRRPLVGYTPVALATVATMIVGFGVWVHHMFATGLPPLSLSFFSGISIIIAVPSAITVFAWVATIWHGRPVRTTAFLFFASTIVLFVIGGVSGFMTASVPADWQFTDTYFVVAHFHYTLIGINIFPVIGGLYYWFPKMTGRMLDERLGKWNFWVLFAGFNLAFLPMHLTGLLGMPRRVYTYGPDMGWNTLNLITTIGAAVMVVGILLLLVNVIASLRHGAKAGDNPWDAAGLEWATRSPPPPYNFAVIPTVASRSPLWEGRLEDVPRRSVLERGATLDHGREAMGTTGLDAQPNLILKMPEDSLAPLLLTIGATIGICGLLAERWWIVIVGAAATALALLAWMWPQRKLGETAEPPR